MKQCSSIRRILIYELQNIWRKKSYYLKVPGAISQNGDFYSNDASPPKKSWFQISVKSVKRFGYKKRLCILQLPINTLLCKPNYGYHN